MKNPLDFFTGNLRIAALQCNFEKDTLKVPDHWKEMGFNVEQLFHPIADCYSANYNSAKHRRLLEQYIRKAQSRGLRIILYLNIHILGPSLQRKAKTWAQRDEKGAMVYLYDGQYPATCVNSPFREYFFNMLKEVSKLDVEGIFLDGPVMREGGCRCVHCKTFHKDLFGNSIEKSSQTWEFRARSKDRFLEEAYAQWKRLCPNRILYMNLPLTHCGSSCVIPEKALAYNDIVGTEGGFFPYGPAMYSYLYKPAFSAKLTEAVAPHKPRVIFMAGDHKPWSWWMHSPQETVQCIASTYANGANIWWGIHGSTDLLKTPSARAAKEVIQFTARNAQAFVKTRSRADTALYYSFATDRYYASSAASSDFYGKGQTKKTPGKPERAIQGWHSLLSEAHIPFDLLTEIGLIPERLAQYRCLALPGIACLSSPEASLIRNWVHNGGTLFAEFDTSLYNERGELQKDFQLADLFGVHAGKGTLEHNNFNYFKMEESRLLHAVGGSPLLPLPLKSIPVRAKVGTNILARRLGEMPGRYTPLTKPESPFFVTRSYGKGRSYYCAGTFGEMYNSYRPLEYRSLIEALIRQHASPILTIPDAPDSLECTVRERADSLFVHLVQHGNGVSRPSDVPPVINALELFAGKGIRFVQAKSLKTRKRLCISSGGQKILLPQLHQYDVIQVEVRR